MRSDLSSNREALDTEVEVRALGALDPDLPRQVLVAVVAVVQRLLPVASSPARRREGVRRIPARRNPPPLRPAAKTGRALHYTTR
jgi:hypothetical protein